MRSTSVPKSHDFAPPEQWFRYHDWTPLFFQHGHRWHGFSEHGIPHTGCHYTIYLHPIRWPHNSFDCQGSHSVWTRRISLDYSNEWRQGSQTRTEHLMRTIMRSLAIPIDGGTVSLSSRKQEIVTLSTTEAELVTATHPANHSPMVLTEKSSHHARTKNIDISQIPLYLLRSSGWQDQTLD